MNPESAYTKLFPGAIPYEQLRAQFYPKEILFLFKEFLLGFTADLMLHTFPRRVSFPSLPPSRKYLFPIINDLSPSMRKLNLEGLSSPHLEANERFGGMAMLHQGNGFSFEILGILKTKDNVLAPSAIVYFAHFVIDASCESEPVAIIPARI